MKNATFKHTISRCATLVVMFVVCTIVMAACSKEPFLGTDVEIEKIDYVAETNDGVAVKSSLEAYISPSVSNDGFSGALRRRLTNQIPVLNDDNIETLTTLVIHNTDIALMANDEELLSSLFVQLLVGNNIVIVEPTLEGLENFFKTITSAYEVINDDEEGKEIFDEAEQLAVPGARQVFEAFHEMARDNSSIKTLFAVESDKEGILAEAFAIRGSHFHIVERLEQNGNDTKLTIEAVDEHGNVSPVEANPETMENAYNQPISDYSYGLVADMFTSWINEQEYYTEEYKESSARAIKDINSRAETNKLSLADIANVQKVEYTISVDSPYDVAPKLPVLVRFEVCSVYKENEDCDYYCIYKSIRSYNQKLDCGPSESRQWRTTERLRYLFVYPYTTESKWVYYNYYGPFMHHIAGESYCVSAEENVAKSDGGIITLNYMPNIVKPNSKIRIEEYAPKNSIGSVDVTSGFSYSLDGGLSFGSETSVGVTAGISYDCQTSQTIDDLDIQVTTDDGAAKWWYQGQNLPQSHMNLILKASHDEAPSILQSECCVDQSWIWRVANPEGAYALYDRTEVGTSLLYYDDWWVYTKQYYSQAATQKFTCFLMLPPPRNNQCWIRDVVPYNDEVNSLLGSLHNKYWDANNYEFMLPDTNAESRISITQFINDFQRDLEDKQMVWRNRGLVPEGKKYTFYFYPKGSNEPYEMEFKFE